MDSKLKRWLKIAGCAALVVIAALVTFEQQIRYLAFRYLDESSVAIGASVVQVGPMWVPLPNAKPNSVTLVKIEPFGAKTRGMMTFSSATNEEVALVAHVPGVTFPWGQAKVGRAQSDLIVAIPSERLTLVSDAEANLSEILSVGPRK